MDIREFDCWLAEPTWPKVTCPECRMGGLELDGTPARALDPQSEELVDLNSRNLGPPEELVGTFHGQLVCDNARCRRKVSIAGDWQLVFNDEDPWNDQFVARFRVRYTNPPMRIMELPAHTPDPVVRAVESAATVLWASPASAANRLRFAVEQLLTARKIRRFNRAKGRPCVPSSFTRASMTSEQPTEMWLTPLRQ
jgi:hypothetical protein